MGYISAYRTAVISGLACAALAGAQASSVFSYKDCPDVTDADFKVTTLVANSTNPETQEPLKMAFDMDAAGNTDVYFVQRAGLIRKYSGEKKTVVNLAKLEVSTETSDGLIGIALDPAFKINRWVYLFYTTATDWRVGRFTLNGEKLDLATEKVVITIPARAGSQHTGGAMQFDWDGNLWITTADNNSSKVSANTFDLRGKILRIKPTADGKYEVPAGNLFPVGTAKTMPEIYIMGSRNPYSLTLDPSRKAVTWGDVGPDFGGISEEHNLTSKPGNFGWPFYAGDNIKLGGGGTAEAPINTESGNTGLTNLPPAIPAVDSYKQNCAITGPVYHYNRIPNHAGKMPPHFDGKWFVTDYGHGKMSALTLDASGMKILKQDTVFRNIRLSRPLDFQAGPDGNFYVVNYAGSRSTTGTTGLLKIEYTGTCAPPPTGVAVGQAQPAGIVPRIESLGRIVSISSQGSHVLEVMEISGRVVASFRGEGPARYDLAKAGNRGVYILNLGTERGSWSRKIMLP
jgi:cytochrome c